MARLVFESSDLLRLIYSFGNPAHRTCMKNILSEIQAKPQEFDDTFQRNKENYKSLNLYLLDYSIDTIQKELTTYKRCFCCARHNNNKPILSNGCFILTEPSVFENTDTICDCPCRSLSRNFIRHLNVRMD
jgi:hypothetical protein